MSVNAACLVSGLAQNTRQLNGSFEAARGRGVPAGWTVSRGIGSADRRVAHGGKVSLLLEPKDGSDIRLESPPLPLSVGTRYEIRAWVRTEQLEVRDLDRVPVTVGATLSMASLPFDVHSEALAGTRAWTELRLRFTATREQDRILCLAGAGGTARGKVWIDDMAIEEAAGEPEWPVRAAIETFGPAYRYPQAGWIYLHIEGKPYERGYQHGFLMAREIPEYLDRCALETDSRAKRSGWDRARVTADALFLRGFDKEILEEMKGIAEGASARGARWEGRSIDLVDVVAMNTVVELGTLWGALPVTPSGLEGLGLRPPEYFDPKRDVPPGERCSAFAATGPATRDGKMVIGHITMWPLNLAEQTNVMLDVKPVQGHRVLMQSYPGGIQSGTDYYQNDAGMVLTETTIRQSPFNSSGLPVAFRARKAIQYGTSVEEVVGHLSSKNNGLYTNEWLIGDAKSNEIGMLELGTGRSKLHLSSKKEWFGGTEGFYWGCNNAKDLAVRLEYAPDPLGKPVFLPYVPNPRDIKWQELYQQSKGAIDEQFAFRAFRTAPLVSASSFDAKVATSSMVSKLMCWAVLGKPNGREWTPSEWHRKSYPRITGIYSGGYSLFQAEPPKRIQDVIRAREQERVTTERKPPAREPEPVSYKDRLWRGWVLPAGDADTWLSAGSEAYYRVLSSSHRENELERHRAGFRAAALVKDIPLNKLEASTTSRLWYELSLHKGVLLLDALKRELGEERFFKFLGEFFEMHTTKRVLSGQFVAAAEKASGAPMDAFFSRWLEQPGLPESSDRPASGAAYLISSLHERLASAVIVYGTVKEAGANRYAAERLQATFLESYERRVPIFKDFEIAQEDLQWHDVVFVGRPETNSLLNQMAGKIGLRYSQASFTVNEKEYPSERAALAVAKSNPLDRSRMMLVLAANSPVETVRLTGLEESRYEYAVFDRGRLITSGFERPSK